MSRQVGLASEAGTATQFEQNQLRVFAILVALVFIVLVAPVALELRILFRRPEFQGSSSGGNSW
jgi:hypothetical protein